MSGVADPHSVREQYATEAGLAARKAVYRDARGPNPSEIAFERIAMASPRRILDVGCGEGELAERMARELEAEVIAVDQSERMVELSRGRGVDARVGDVQELPFADASFDVVVAAWMLYHVPDVNRGLQEIERVLRSGGTLVATTNDSDHLAELFELTGAGPTRLPFSGENAEDILASRFSAIERIDAGGTVLFPDIETVRSYYASSGRLAPFLDRLPETLDEPLVVRRRPVVLVARKAV